jgi:hypothetical protein
LAALTAVVAYRKRKQLEITVVGLEDCPIAAYLRRMNLLRLCGWETDGEAFRRHDPAGRFVPLEPITHRVDDLGAQVAACIAPGSRIVDLMGGHILVASGAGTDIRGGGPELRKSPLPGGGRLPGTLVALSFRRSAAADFDAKLHNAKELETLLRDSKNTATFQP